MRLTFIFKYLAVVPGLLAGTALAASDSQLEEAQARVAQAMNSARLHRSSSAASAEGGSISQALGSLNQLVNERMKESDNHFFGKVFDEHGKVIGNASGKGAPALSQASAEPSDFGRKKSVRQERAPARAEEYVIDPSKVKKEIVFGSPSKKSAR